MNDSARKGKLQKVKKAAVKKPAAKKPAKAKTVAPTSGAGKNPHPVKAAKPTGSVQSSSPTAKPASAAKKEPPKPSGGKTAVAPDLAPKRPTRLFFIEVKPGAERVIKRGDKSLAAPAPVDIQARRKESASEETPEELVERIEKELQHQSFFKRTSLKPQMCTKCGIHVVAEKFTIDRELGYCENCADILRLGATKEARRMEFNPSMKKEGEGASPTPSGGEGASAAGDSEGEEEPLPDLD